MLYRISIDIQNSINDLLFGGYFFSSELQFEKLSCSAKMFVNSLSIAVKSLEKMLAYNSFNLQIIFFQKFFSDQHFTLYPH